jgi:hypothetical protein
MSDVADEREVLEHAQPFSRSLLWRVQRAFFDREGIAAWSRHTVPHYITGNPYLADAFARVVAAWLRDGRDVSDSAQPIYIVEIGAGTGRFGWHFLRRLTELTTECPQLKWTYVMTDVAQPVIDAWRAHPWLRPLVERGQLDFARFDGEHDTELALLHSGTRLDTATLSNPLVVLANYFFDSIPCDLFVMRDGQLYEREVTVRAALSNRNLDDPGLFSRAELSFSEHSVRIGHYGDADLDRILEFYRTWTDWRADATLVFPCAALRCLKRLHALAKGRLFFLGADKGYVREDAVTRLQYPGVALHGSISFSVNFHALTRYVADHGGRVLQTSRHCQRLQTVGFLFGELSGDAATRAFDEALVRSGPDDYYALIKVIERAYPQMSFDQLLSFIRFSRWDPILFYGCAPVLRQRLADASDEQKAELLDVIDRVWQSYLPIGESEDLAFEVGALLEALDDPEAALRHFGVSREVHGATTRTALQMAICHERLGQIELAISSCDEALALDPDCEPARTRRERLQPTRMRADEASAPEPCARSRR